MGWQIVSDAAGNRTTEWVIPDNAAGHHLDSAAPGTAGNVVISGHNNIGGAVFAPISLDQDQAAPQLVPGSTITVFADDGQQYVYQVQKVDRVAEENVPLTQRLANARYLEPTREPTLTLITCWPPDGFSHRIIVVANSGNSRHILHDEERSFLWKYVSTRLFCVAGPG
jgi:sortase A